MITTTVYPHSDGLFYTVWVWKEKNEVECYVIGFTGKVTDDDVRKVATNVFKSGIRGIDLI